MTMKSMKGFIIGLKPTPNLLLFVLIWTSVVFLLEINLLETSMVHHEITSVNNDANLGRIIVPTRTLFRSCTSPESAVSWPFHDEYRAPNPNPASPVVHSLLNPHLKCGLGLKRREGQEHILNPKDMFIEYFDNTVKKEIVQPILDQEGCDDMVVFGAAFGKAYVKYMTNVIDNNSSLVDPENLVEKHGRCFFMFTNHEGPEEEAVAQQLGHYWLVPLVTKYLPYENNRRNAKLIKYMGHYAFLNHPPDRSDKVALSSPKNIVWQDAKFFREVFIHSMPRDYDTIIRPKDSNTYSYSEPNSHSELPCVSAMALPVDENTFGVSPANGTSLGLALSTYTRPSYEDHCKTIIAALTSRPGVTDSPEALIGQCELYMEYVHEKEEQRKATENENNNKGNDNEEHDSLNFGLIDTAFLVWNESTQQCRDFNAILRCTLLDQLQCHSDRDQVLFPMVVHQLVSPHKHVVHTLAPLTSGENTTNSTNKTTVQHDEPAYSLKAVYYNSWTKTQSSLDKNWIPHAHDLDLVDLNPTPNADANQRHGKQQVYMRMQRSSCHWYFFKYTPNQPLGERTCGHKLWLRENLKRKNPSLEQEVEIAVWLDNRKLSEYQDHSVFAEVDPLSLASKRGSMDIIEAPYAADFHKCTSPEHSKVSWTFREQRVEGKEPALSCGTHKGHLSAFHQKLQKSIVHTKILPYANNEDCSEYVLFGAAFEMNINDLKLSDDEEIQRQRQKELGSLNLNKCSFLFVLEETPPAGFEERKGNYRLIPISQDLLPYESMTRNSKLFQYSGQFLFPNTKTVIYQDAPTFLSKKYLNRQPVTLKYLYPRSKINPESCLTVFSLPFLKSRAGNGDKNNTIQRDLEFFPGYCKHLVNVMEGHGLDDTTTGFSLESDSSSSIIQQCDAYLQFVYKRELNTDVLNQGLADTNYMIWNENNEFCREFNAQLRCTILDQLHCHSSNDKLVFPFALYVNQMGQGSRTEYEIIDENGHITRRPVDFDFVKKNHTLNYFLQPPFDKAFEEPTKHDVVKIVRENLHWMNYTSACKDDKKFRYRNGKQKCSWVGEKIKRCNWLKDGIPLKHWCPESCFECQYTNPCVDDKTFRYKNNKQHCGWVGEKLKRCKWPKDGLPLKHWCPESCLLCEENNDEPDATMAATMIQDVLYSDLYSDFKERYHEPPYYEDGDENQKSAADQRHAAQLSFG